MERQLEQEAVLVTYSSRQWPGRKQTKEGNKAISEKFGNDENATKTTKYLIDPEELSKTAKYFSAAYSFYREMTLPWQDTKGAARFLPGKNYPAFKEGIDALIDAAMNRAEEFCQDYPRLIEEYRPRLRGIYNPADYPTPDRIRAEFAINITPQPLPMSPASLTLKFLGADELRKMREDLAGQWERQENNAMADLYRRLMEPVKAMADRLADPDAKFKNSLVDNLTEIADLLPDLNFKDDPELDRLTQEIKNKLTTIDPETLRINKRVRAQVAGEAVNILEQITGAGARFIDLTPEPGEEPAPSPEFNPIPEAAPATPAAPSLF